jgi:2,3-bisphosphoglycerate-dependent phosphoglycerate mutase
MLVPDADVARDSSVVIVFESHGASLDNEAGLASGWFDVGLSATGEEQARGLGVRRRDDDLAAVFCSDLTRAFRTAEIAFGDRTVPIFCDARLRECDYGEFTRHSASDIEQRRAIHVAIPFPQGESYEQVVGRVSAWLTDATTRFARRTVLVIGHRATFYALEHLIRHVPLQDAVTSTWQWQPGWTYRIVRDDRARDRDSHT